MKTAGLIASILLSAVSLTSTAAASDEPASVVDGAEPAAVEPVIDAHSLLLNATKVNARELGAIARALHAQEYIAVGSHAMVTLLAGDRVIRLGAGFGEVAPMNVSLPDGIYWNIGPGHLRFVLGKPDPAFADSLPPNSILVVGAAFVKQNDPRGGSDVPSSSAKGGSCSAACDSGYYACCDRIGASSAFCRCVAKTTVIECDSGGAGATTCSITNP